MLKPLKATTLCLICLICLIGIVCCGLVLATAEQTRPNKNPAPIQVAPGQLPQPVVQPKAQPGAIKVAPEEHHKAHVARVFDELFTKGRYEAVDQIYLKNCQVHNGNRHQGLQEAVNEGKGWRSAAPDLVMTAHQMSVQGDIVTVSWTARGTHTGHGNGLKPSGKPILIHGVSRFRMADGKIAEVWNDYDHNELYRQIGVSPKLGQLYEASQDAWAAVTRFFSGTDDAGDSAQPSR